MADNQIFFTLSLTELIENIRSVVRAELQSANKVTEEDRILRPVEVCEILGISRPTLITWQKTGKIQAFRIGRRVYFKNSSVESALRKIKTGAL